MGWFADKLTQRSNAPKVGDTIVAFDCLGCMAEDHQFKWMGFVDKHHKKKLSTSSGDKMVPSVMVTIVKTQHKDVRDTFLGQKNVIVDTAVLQHLFGPVWALYE